MTDPTPTPDTPARPLHILRAGTWTDMHGRAVTLTPADLADIARHYDPTRHRAPLVVGHPKDSSPAFGWFAALRAEGGDLFGMPEQVDPAFAVAVREGRYPERSASLLPPAHPQNPVPTSWYLRHVGVLGGVAPAVKGLRGADLAAGDADIITLNLAGPSWADPLLEPTPMPETSAADLAAQVADLEARAAAVEVQAKQLKVQEAELEARAKALTAQAKAQEAASMLAFCEHLADEARIRPADVAPLAALLLSLPTEPAADFAAPTDDTAAPAAPGAFMQRFLSHLPPIVELAEVATKNRAKPQTAPDDSAIVSKARALHAAALAAGDPISFTVAVDRATQEAK